MFRWFLATLACLATVTSASAAYTIVTMPSMGPDPNSPSYTPWAMNAIAGIAGQVGSPANPSIMAYGSNSGTDFYYPGSPAIGNNGYVVNGGAMTSIVPPNGPGVNNLWNGVVNFPNSGFQNEIGNWVYYGFAIKSAGGAESFTTADVTFSGFSVNPPSGISFLPPGFLAGNATGLAPSGLLLGATTPGGALSQVADGTPYAEMYYIGFGLSNQAAFTGTDARPDQYATIPGLYDLMNTNDPVNGYNVSGLLNGTWTVSNGVVAGASSTGTFDINGSTPAPATVVLMGVGLAGLAARIRRRKTA